MDKVITAIFDGIAKLQAGKMLIFLGGLMFLASGVVRVGAFEFAPAMAEDMRDGGIVILLLGAYFAWYKGKADAAERRTEMEERRTRDLLAFHERLGALEARVSSYHGDDNG